MRASDYIGISEKIRSNEIKLQGELSEINGKISSLYSRIDSLESELQILQMELNAALSETDEEGNVDMGAVSAIRSRMSAVYSQINSCQSEISNYESEKKRIETELQSVEIEKQATLSEIQFAASVKSQNISKLASGLSGDYANIGQNLQSTFQVSLGHLSQAASILGGTIAVSSGGGNSGGGSSSTGRSNPRSSSNIAAVGGTGSKNRPSVSASNLSVKPVGATGFGGKSSIQSKLTPVASSTKQGSTGQLQSASKVNLPKVANSGGASMTSLPSATSTDGAVNISSTFSARGITTIADKEVVSGSEPPFSASPHTFRDYLNPVNYDSNGHYTGDYRSPVLQTAQAVVDYNNWINNGGIDMQRIDYRKNGGAVQGIVTAQNIFDVFGVDSPNFWNYKSRSQSDYIDMASHIPLVRMHLDNGKSLADIESMGGVLGACATQYFRNPVQVMKYGDAYIHCSDGRHRTVAAQIAKVEMPVAIVQEFHTSDKSRLFDETIKTIIRPEILANILYSEARLKKSGTGAYARLQRNQNNWNDMGIQVYDEHGKEIVKTTDAKTYEESYVDIQKAKGTALEEAIAYTLRPNSKKIQIQRVVQSAKGRSTKPDVIALNATHDIKIGGEYVVAGESIVIEAKCGDAFYLTSEIEHIAHQLSGYDKLEEELKPEMKGRLHRTLMLTQDYERMSDAAKKALNEVAKKYKTSISILPFYACDMTRAVMLADVRGKLNV